MIELMFVDGGLVDSQSVDASRSSTAPQLTGSQNLQPSLKRPERWGETTSGDDSIFMLPWDTFEDGFESLIDIGLDVSNLDQSGAGFY